MNFWTNGDCDSMQAGPRKVYVAGLWEKLLYCSAWQLFPKCLF